MHAFHLFVNHTPERQDRTYAIWVQQDLFGQWTLVRINGGRHREPVRYSQVVESREAGEQLIDQIVKVRLRHGYIAVERS